MRTRRPTVPIVLGLALLLVLWMTPLPTMGRQSFTAHMILHLGIVIGATPLLALGLTRTARGRAIFQGGWSLALLAVLFDMLAVWIWHAPGPHAAAARSLPIFMVQQSCFLLAGLLVWGTSLGRQTRADVASSVLVTFATFTHMTMLGVVLATASRTIYPLDVCGGGFGLVPLADQQVGGALMAVGGGLPYLAAALLGLRRILEDA